MPISILLVDDHSIVRHGLASLLATDPDFVVVGEAGDGDEGVRLAQELKPDVIVMDIGMPNVGGVEATRLILERNPDALILALSAYGDRQHVVTVLRAGARGYVIKDSGIEELTRAIHAVDAGERYVSAALSHTLIQESLSGHGGASKDGLTAREREVLQLLAGGKAMKQAAIELQISTKTVETHRRAIMEKLQLFSVAELTKHAIREGLTPLE